MNITVRDFATDLTNYYTIDDLNDKLATGPDDNDMNDWGIGDIEWTSAVKMAIGSLKHGYSLDD